MSAQTDPTFPNNLPPGWKKRLSAEKEKPYFRTLATFLKGEYAGRKTVYPARANVLRALQAVDYDAVKVVILGQDPYHGAGQAIGLSFAVPNELRLKPPSLQNIFKEIESDLKLSMKGKGTDLSGWVDQGVLLLNSVLTVRASEAFSHRNQGWETFTDLVIRDLNEREEPVIFVLWGSAAQRKRELITHKRHRILESAHPSPLSAHRGFFGSRPFSKINEILKELGRETIDWSRTTANTEH